jgi:hypothetical protein
MDRSARRGPHSSCLAVSAPMDHIRRGWPIPLPFASILTLSGSIRASGSIQGCSDRSTFIWTGPFFWTDLRPMGSTGEGWTDGEDGGISTRALRLNREGRALAHIGIPVPTSPNGASSAGSTDSEGLADGDWGSWLTPGRRSGTGDMPMGTHSAAVPDPS